MWMWYYFVTPRWLCFMWVWVEKEMWYVVYYYFYPLPHVTFCDVVLLLSLLFYRPHVGDVKLRKMSSYFFYCSPTLIVLYVCVWWCRPHVVCIDSICPTYGVLERCIGISSCIVSVTLWFREMLWFSVVHSPGGESASARWCSGSEFQLSIFLFGYLLVSLGLPRQVTALNSRHAHNCSGFSGHSAVSTTCAPYRVRTDAIAIASSLVTITVWVFEVD